MPVTGSVNEKRPITPCCARKNCRISASSPSSSRPSWIRHHRIGDPPLLYRCSVPSTNVRISVTKEVLQVRGYCATAEVLSVGNILMMIVRVVPARHLTRESEALPRAPRLQCHPDDR